MSESIEDKQDFLRDAILDKGYDGNQFMAFLQEKKGEEIDLNEWSLEELRLAVSEFIKKITGETQVQPEPTTENPLQPREEIAPSDQARTDVPQPSLPEGADLEGEEKKEEEKKTEQKPTPKIAYNETKESVKCITSKRTQFSNCPNPSISLSLPEKIEGGLFTKSYVTYLVEAIPLGTKVRKRYSDFEWLRQMMGNIYLGSVIPPIPKKNYGDRFNEVFISKRMRALEKFMNGLAVDPLMRDSAVLCDFLTIENEGDWNNRKNAFNKMKTPQVITELLSLNGELKTSISGEKEMYFTNIKDNANNNETLLQKLLTSYKELIAEMNNVSRIMADISFIFHALYENSEKYFEDKKTTDSYNVMSKLMQDWSDSEKRQSDLLTLEIKEYFRYIKKEFVSMKELIAKVDYNKTNYKKAEEKLIYKKEDLFKRQDFTRWDLPESELKNKMRLIQDKDYAFSRMLPKETTQVLNLKYTYGFYLNRIIEEYERLRTLNGIRHSTRINGYCKKNTDIITDLHVGIADLVSYFADSGEK